MHVAIFQWANIHNFDHLSHIFAHTAALHYYMRLKSSSGPALSAQCLPYLLIFSSCDQRKNMRRVIVKPISRVNDQVRHNRSSTTTENGYRLDISDLESMNRERDCPIYVSNKCADQLRGYCAGFLMTPLK